MIRKRTAVLAVCLCLFSCFSIARAEAASLGVIPFYSPEKMWTLYTPFIEYLTKATGTPWELKLFHNHEAMIDGVCKGEVSVAFLGPVPFGRVQEKCSVKPLIVALGSDGKPLYRSIIITADAGISSLRDLKGKDFGIFEGSTAAHVLPVKMLHDEGITIEMLKLRSYPGQDKIIDALLRQEIAAAGVKEALYEKFKGKGIKLLKASGYVPNFVFCSSSSLPADIERKFIDQLLALSPGTKPDHQVLMSGWDTEVRNGFIRPPENYSRQALELSDLFRKFAK